MSQTDGEKELVLGNKQLISLFFVAVALCGVFFAMGYMIGRDASKPGAVNSDGSVSTAAAAPAPQSQQSQTDDADASQAAPAQPPSQPETSDAEPPRDTPPAETQPAREETASAPPAPVRTAPVQPKAAKTAPAVPEPGATYLQVTALRRSDADNLVKTLREQNFPALVADSSKPELFRVLVGPYHQTVDVAGAKERLKALGFANAFVYK